VVKLVIETENDMILDLDINMASAHPMMPWRVLGKRGSIVYDQESKAWKVRFFRAEELANVEVQTELAAEGRRYGSGETIPWKEATFAASDFQPIDFYQKCYEYYALDASPFIPIAETREVMRVLDACHRNAGGA